MKLNPSNIDRTADKVHRTLGKLLFNVLVNPVSVLVRSVRKVWLELVISLLVLLILTMFLVSFMMLDPWIENGERMGYWSTVGALLADYIDVRSVSADAYSPIATVGKACRIAIAIVKIAVFAIPTGLLASGFTEVIKEDQRKKYLNGVLKRISKIFLPRQDKPTLRRVTPRYRYVSNIMAKYGIDAKDLIEAVAVSQYYRLCNLSEAGRDMPEVPDRLVIESIKKTGAEDKNFKSYGYCINRHSPITIVAPTAYREVGIGNFAYYLAKIGNFNYISREWVVPKEEVDSPGSFYTPKSGTKKKEYFKEYLKDIKELGIGGWVIFLIASDSVHEASVHFVTRINEDFVPDGSTIINKRKCAILYAVLSAVIERRFGYKSELNRDYRAVKSRNISFLVGGGIDMNAFTIRLDWKIFAYDHRSIAITECMADCIRRTLISYDSKIHNNKI